MARRKKDKSLEEFEAMIAKARLKTKAYTLCSLYDELETQEGQEKRMIIQKYLSSDDLEKFKQYLSIFTSVLDKEPIIQVYVERKNQIEEKINYCLKSIVAEARYCFNLNRLLREDPIPVEEKEAIKRTLVNSDLNYRLLPLLCKKQYSEEYEAFYLEPIDIWSELQKLKEDYIRIINRAKPYVIALIEYLDKYTFKEEYLNEQTKKDLKALKTNYFESWFLSREWLTEWLKAVAELRTEKDFNSWITAPPLALAPPLLPDYEEIDPNGEYMATYTGRNNYFDIWVDIK